jgi:hypothetical protein
MTGLRIFALAAALLAIFSVTPCLAGEPTACDLITQEDAAKALGMKVAPGKPTNPNPIGQTICFFDGEGADKVRYVQVQLTLPPPKMRKNMSAAKLFAGITGNLDGGQPVEGIGEKAVWGGSGMKMGAGLHVLLGDYYFTVDVASGDANRNLAEAKKLAKMIVEKLK